MGAIRAAMAAAMFLAAPDAMAGGRRPATPADTLSALETALGAYEEVRALLAADTTGGVGAAAGRIRAASRRAAREAPASLREPIAALRQSAADLERRARSSEEIEHIRWAFGEVSRAVVALLRIETALARDRHVFRCPVTHTYKKWVQTTDRVSNPYMGTMLAGCGQPVL